IDDQFKKEQRRAKKSKEETGWHALTVFEGTRDEGVKWRRATEAAWSAAVEDLHLRQDEAAFLLKRCGRWSVATPEEAQAILAAAEAAPAPAVEGSPTPGEGPEEAPASEPPEQPAEDNPLTRLRADLAKIEHELLALDALKLPKFLQIQNLLWPALLLGAAAAGALGALTPVGWVVAGVVGAV